MAASQGKGQQGTPEWSDGGNEMKLRGHLPKSIQQTEASQSKVASYLAIQS